MGEQIFLERFFWFDQQLRSSRYPNAATLAAQFEIAAKTAQRSIDYFRDRLGAPLEYDPLRRGYAYSADYTLAGAALSETELVALLLSRRLLADVAAGALEGELTAVVTRLGGLLSRHLPGRLAPDDAFSFRWSRYLPTRSDDFQRIALALLSGQTLSFVYAAPGGAEPEARTVEPHHLLNYHGTWHLIAYCRLRQGWRDFVLSRMRDIDTGEPFPFRPRSEWEGLLSGSYGLLPKEDACPVRLHFSVAASRQVRGQIWHPQQSVEEQSDGSLVLTVPVSHPAEITANILAHGAGVRVLSPDWLAETVRSEIALMQAVYAEQEKNLPKE